MFQNAYQGGPAVEIFTTQGKNPLASWKTSGNLQKIYDKGVKGYIYVLDSGLCKMQLPKDEKSTLGIVQPYMVFQVFLPEGMNLHLELGITDNSKSKRRLIFHSGAKEIVTNPLHARIPLDCFRRGEWVNLSIDVLSFVHECFKGYSFRSIDSIYLTSHCKLRRIFSMKSPILETDVEDDIEYLELSGYERPPRAQDFPPGVFYKNQLVFLARVQMLIQESASQ